MSHKDGADHINVPDPLSEQRTSNPATADELRALATKAITDLWVLVGGQQTEIERLTRELGISAEECHVGMFDLERCRRAAEALRTWRGSNG